MLAPEEDQADRRPIWDALQMFWFETGWLSNGVLSVNRYGRRLPIEYLHPHSNYWWQKLCGEIERIRNDHPR